MKIALIVDNPTRDLDGLALLARKLSLLGHDVFLVPMYAAGYEIPLLLPEFVLFNYARKANHNLMRSFKKSGIGIGVLDTEGGIWESPEQYIKSIAHRELGPCIDQYYVWGPLQQKAFADHTTINPEIISVTGCPRYDFCVEPWLSSIKAIDDIATGYILIISNFALSCPRFVSPETEIANMVAAGYDQHYAEARAKDEQSSKKRLIEVLRHAASKYPQKIFVIRTHPFEDDREYKTVFAEFANIKIVRAGTVSTWLKSAALTLHINSSVGVDAALMKVPVYSADWISTPIAKGMSELPLQVSIRLNSVDEFFKAIENPTGQHPSKESEKALHDWFYLSDGKAHERIARLINTFLADRRPAPDQAFCRKLFFFGSQKTTNWIGYIDAFGRLILGGKAYRWVRNNILTKNVFKQTKSDKFFSVAEINEILSKLNKIDFSSVVAVELTQANSLCSRAVSDSVFIPAKKPSP